MGDLISELLNELERYIKNEQSADGFPEDTLLEDGQAVKVKADTYANNQMIYIWQIQSVGEQTLYISSVHSDNGVTVSRGGPWSSLSAAQDEYDDCNEGWTLYE